MGFLEDLLDAGEKTMDRVESHAENIANQGGWKVTEILDADGEDAKFWNVSNDEDQKIHVHTSEALANKICNLLNKDAK